MFRITALVFTLFIPLISCAQKLTESYYRANAAIHYKDYELANIWIDSAINSSPRNPLFWLKKGEIQFQSNHFDEAITSLNMAEKYRVGIASYWLAKSYAMKSDTANAFAELKRHLTSSPKEVEARILLDTAFNSIKAFHQWKKLWLENWYSPSELLVADIDYLFSRFEWDHALDILNEKMEGKKSRHQLFALRGEAYFNVGSFKAAEEDFAQALAKSRRNHSYMAWRAKALMAVSKHGKAIKYLNNAIDLSGGEPQYYYLRSIAFAGNKEYIKAVDDIRYYLSFYPQDMIAIASFAEYLMEAGKTIDALFQLGKLIKEHPFDPKFYSMRAKIYMKSSNWEMAEIDLNKTLSLNPSIAEAFLNRGICKHNLGKSSEACSDWKQAIKLGNFQAQEFVYKNCR